MDAYRRDTQPATLLEDPYFAGIVAQGEAAWRRVVVIAAQSAVPAPGFYAALAYYDALAPSAFRPRSSRGQRDFFGAHTYKRVDRPGTFHTLWSDDRTEVEVG
jgi:6-phosphogluconate dehydrogenase